jgi:hypothetical protein
MYYRIRPNLNHELDEYTSNHISESKNNTLKVPEVQSKPTHTAMNDASTSHVRQVHMPTQVPPNNRNPAVDAPAQGFEPRRPRGSARANSNSNSHQTKPPPAKEIQLQSNRPLSGKAVEFTPSVSIAGAARTAQPQSAPSVRNAEGKCDADRAPGVPAQSPPAVASSRRFPCHLCKFTALEKRDLHSHLRSVHNFSHFPGQPAGPPHSVALSTQVPVQGAVKDEGSDEEVDQIGNESNGGRGGGGMRGRGAGLRGRGRASGDQVRKTQHY